MKFNDQQLKIINTDGGRICVIAGAGSGKTTTTVKLIEKLHLEDSIPLEKMFISTFTNKAGKDIKDRLRKRFKMDSERIEKLWVGTFHGLGHRYLTQIKKLKLNLILPVEASYYLKNIYKAVLQGEGEDETTIPFKTISENIEQQRNQNCSWDDASDHPEICKKIHNQYQKEKSEQDLVDFTDILEIFVNQLKADDVFTNRFSWVFVDEVQDNNFYQHEIAEKLANGRNIYYCGDLKQILYVWRGADPQLFKDKIKEADHTYRLSYNYRSTQQIIGFANAMLTQIPSFHGQELKPLPINGFKPVFIICDSIALQIYKAIRHDIRSGIPIGEIAVLARSVKPATIQSLQVLLRRDRIPYTVRGGSDKLNAPFIQNFLSILKSVANPTKVSLVNAMSILPSVGPKTAFKLAETVVSDGMSFRSLHASSGRFAQTKAFKDYLNLKYLQDNDTMKELLLRSFDFYHEHYLVHQYGKKDPSEPSNKKTIIFEVLYNYLMGYKTLAEGIDSLYVNDDDEEDSDKKIVISTVHQSKGLEWDSVHIANMNEFAIPFIGPDFEGDENKLEEEFCLAYVASTRAKKNLRMYMQFMNGNYQGARPNKISRFVKELLRTTGEQHMTLRVLDVPNELNYKHNLMAKIRG